VPEKKHKKLFFMGFLLLVNSALELLGLGAIFPIFSVLLEDDVLNKHELLNSIYNLFSLSNEKQLIIILSIGMLLIVVGKNILNLWIVKINARFALGLYKDLAMKLHKYYYSKGLNYFKNTNSNVIVRNLRGATREFSQLQVLGSFNLLNELIILLLIVVFILFAYPKILFLLLFTVVPPFYIFYKWVRVRSIEMGNQYNKVVPIVGKNMFQSIFGYVDIIVMGAEKQFRKKIKENIEDLVSINIKSVLYNLAPSRVIESSLMLAIVIIISFGIYYLPSKTDLVMLLGVFVVAGYKIMPSINRMMIAINGLNRSIWIMDALKPLQNHNLKFNKSVKDGLYPLKFESQIQLKNISYRYSENSEFIFKDYNLTINKGEVIGIIGSSGSGKTTLMNILLGFLEPTQGNYLIDNVSLNEINKNSFYDKVGYVQQQVYLIDETIAANVAFGHGKKEIDFKKLEVALKRANLWEMIEGLPEGVNELIGENGTKLSGGQRQRLGIARALYSESEILFFDEATSSLDTETEQEVTEAIQKLSDGKLTIIIIAHRLSTLNQCDRIIRVDPINRDMNKSNNRIGNV